MPRRNRNVIPSRRTAAQPDPQLSLLCVACCLRPATTGTHCAPCKGAITRQARREALRRR